MFSLNTTDSDNDGDLLIDDGGAQLPSASFSSPTKPLEEKKVAALEEQQKPKPGRLRRGTLFKPEEESKSPIKAGDPKRALLIDIQVQNPQRALRTRAQTAKTRFVL
jgi:hypothetical protein